MRQQLDEARSDSARERQQVRADIAKLEEENATYRREVARLSAAADAASATQRKLDVGAYIQLDAVLMTMLLGVSGQ